MIWARYGALVHLVEEHSGRAVELGDDDPLGAVDDEGAVVGHERDVPEVDFLLLDIPDRPHPRLRVLVVHRETDGDLERNGVRHAPLLALLDVVLELQTDGVAASVADRAPVLVRLAAGRAGNFTVAHGIGANGGAAAGALSPKVLQTLELSALALPDPDGVLHELELAVLAEVGDGEDRLEDRLKTHVFPFRREQVHLKEPLVRLPLDLDEVRDRNHRPDSREIDAIAIGIYGEFLHLCFQTPNDTI